MIVQLMVALSWTSHTTQVDVGLFEGVRIPLK